MTATEQAALSSSAGFLSTTRSSQRAQTDTLTGKPEHREESTQALQS